MSAAGTASRLPAGEARTRFRLPVWVLAAIGVCVLHVAVLGPRVDKSSYILDKIFRADAEAVLDGSKPYADLDYEYPPLSLPLLTAPAAVTEGKRTYREVFGWEIIVWDLATVWLLAYGLRRAPPRQFWAALAVYSAGVLTLDRLPLARFDLVPAVLILAAALAREAGRSATWGLALSAATAVKAFPALLAPAYLRGESRLGRVAAGAAVPVAITAGIMLGLGDEFSSAIAYHSNRDLQIEAVGASPLLIIRELGGPGHPTFGAGSFNIAAPGADAIRFASLLALAAAYLLAVVFIWRRRIGALEAGAIIVGVAVVLAPVLSPQFLFWLLPISAAAFGASLENAVLIGAVLLTRVMQDHYTIDERTGYIDPTLVWSSVGRNALLLVYLGLLAARLLRARSTTTPPSANAGS